MYVEYAFDPFVGSKVHLAYIISASRENISLTCFTASKSVLLGIIRVFIWWTNRKRRFTRIVTVMIYQVYVEIWRRVTQMPRVQFCYSQWRSKVYFRPPRNQVSFYIGSKIDFWWTPIIGRRDSIFRKFLHQLALFWIQVGIFYHLVLLVIYWANSWLWIGLLERLWLWLVHGLSIGNLKVHI